MSNPFSTNSDESSRDVLDAWNLGAADSSDCGFEDSLVAPPREPKPEPPKIQARTPGSAIHDSKPARESWFGGLAGPSDLPGSEPIESFGPLHFTMRKGSPPSGLDPADSLMLDRFALPGDPNPPRLSSIPRDSSRPPGGASQPKLGDVVAGFRLITELGRGAFARVYLAEQIELGNRLVALKVSRPEGDEPQMLARLQHTHIVPIHSVNDDPISGLRLLCMPYLGGANLAQVLEAAGSGPDESPGRISLVHALDEVRQRFQSMAKPSIESFSADRSRDLSGVTSVVTSARSASTALNRSVVKRNTDSLTTCEPNLSRRSFGQIQSFWSRVVWRKTTRDEAQTIASLDERDFDQPARQFLREANSIEAAVWIIARLAEGLEHAHMRGLLHRDLKPSNILIAGDGTPMLLDFNLSTPRRAENPEEGEKAMLGGTLPYMSPEHIDAFNPNGTTSPEAVDERSDIYSLGLILFEAVAGAHPFHEPPPGTPLLQMIKDLADQRRVAPSIRARVPEAPWSLDSIIRKCLDPDPAKRYARARDLSDDLNRFLDDRPLKHAPEPSLRERVQKWKRRNPNLCGTTTVATLAALLIFSLGGLIGLFAHNMQNLSARLKFQVFHQELDECRFLLNVASGPSEHLDQGIKIASRTIDDLVLTKNGDLSSRSWVWRLTANEQAGVRQDAAELIILYARAMVAASKSEGEAARANALKHAVKLLTLGEHLDPAPPQALFSERARFHAALGESQLVAKDREHEAAAIPVSARDFALLGTSLLARGELSRAEASLIRALDLEPKRFWAWFALGYCRFEQGRFVDAAADFQSCILLEPRFAWPRMNRGLCLSRVGRLGEARTCYQQALHANPRFAEAWVNLALVDLELNEISEAETAILKAKDLGRIETPELLVLAEIKARQGNREAAEQLFSTRIKEKGETASVLTARGIFRVDTDRKAALADLRRALELDPSNARAHFGMALALRAEAPRDALAEVNAALSADSSLLDALQLRSLLRARLGDLSSIDDVERLCQAQTPHRLYNGACALATLIKTAGETRLASRSLELLGRALDAGIPAELAANDHDLDALHTLPAYDKLLAKHRAMPLPKP